MPDELTLYEDLSPPNFDTKLECKVSSGDLCEYNNALALYLVNNDATGYIDAKYYNGNTGLLVNAYNRCNLFESNWSKLVYSNVENLIAGFDFVIQTHRKVLPHVDLLGFVALDNEDQLIKQVRHILLLDMLEKEKLPLAPLPTFNDF